MPLEILVLAVIVIYGIALLFIFSYSLSQLNLTVLYLREKFFSLKKIPLIKHWDEPEITVQLPIYNELYVAERLINCITQLDYPKDKLQIQVLDDSTDETTVLIDRKVKQFRQEGFNIQHIRREHREGYKAGALAHGLELASGEFIAIFDADFLPQKDFLKRTLGQFSDSSVGVVQTRWDHLNRKYSLLTQLQAFGLDAHFSIEQRGRNAGNHFINFNGTAGVWRKNCINDAGGWQSDTLTEDLDLSYRAQLRGWKFVYLEEVNAPAELPVTMSALKNQQYRWNKGAAECAKKNLGKVWREKNISLSTKLHALFHLMNSTVFIAIVITAVLSVPMLFIKKNFQELHSLFLVASFFLTGFFCLATFYFTAMAQHEKAFPKNFFRFITWFPFFLSVSMGLALHNALAVSEGYLGKKTSFVRTPKFNIVSSTQSWNRNKYLQGVVNAVTIAEGMLALYFGYGIFLAFRLHDFGLISFHIMLTFGFGFVFFYSVIQSLKSISSHPKFMRREKFFRRKGLAANG